MAGANSGGGIAKAPNFYGTLAGDARRAEAVRCGEAPEADDPDRPAARQLGGAAKGRWAAEHFPGVPIITCMARDKHST